MEQLGIDDVYERIGEFGWKQKIYFLLIGVLGLYGPFHQLQMVFVGHDPGFMCQAYFGNGTSLLNSCPDNRVDKCEKITYLGSLTSVVTTWNLVCDRAYLAKTAQSVYMLGTMAIGLPGGRLSDKFGRKRVVVICILMTIICGGMQAFVHDYRSYLLSKFFQGCFYAGTIPSFVLLLELLGPSRRGAVGTLSGLWFSIGIILLSGVAYFVQDWKEFVLVINVGGLVVPALLLLVPESPRWLLLHGREAEAKAVWSSIAEGNGKKFDPSWKIIGNAGVTDSDESASSLLRNPALRRITLIQIFSCAQITPWKARNSVFDNDRFTNSVVYYGLALAAGNFGKDLYLASALSGAVEIPGTLLLLVVFLCR
ncbi:unnamed protein product [Notodromas monacha]|uniref:Major facilitator superfamily (MFS) profile domain-containing protein n=1 Tax=Notodromas monacha TaxID=399045 RepID=A0A7R9GDJ1_9CRUS|nr:unnamed protein product [Notodromas monacha]CAG0918728.1 unnamed protein product [Notodromas monacha]